MYPYVLLCNRHKSKEVTSAIDTFTQAANATAAGVNASAVSEEERLKILAEESRVLDDFKVSIIIAKLWLIQHVLLIQLGRCRQ